MRFPEERVRLVIARVLKYLIEGLAVAIAAYYIPRRGMSPYEIVVLGICAASVFAVLDALAPSLGKVARTGMGVGIGVATVG